jgi:hypothetical protein
MLGWFGLLMPSGTLLKDNTSFTGLLALCFPFPFQLSLANDSQYSSNDTAHSGTAGPDQIRYAYTSDFTTFSPPQTLINYSPSSVIDLCILQLSPTTFLRFMKNETASNVFMELSTTGLFGPWSRPGGSTAFVRSRVEGPYAYKDNTDPSNLVVILDYYGGDGYRPFEGVSKGTQGEGLTNAGWTNASTTGWPTKLRHGSVVGVTKEHYDALTSKWGGWVVW